jgi:hypothetical protein
MRLCSMERARQEIFISQPWGPRYPGIVGRRPAAMAGMRVEHAENELFRAVYGRKGERSTGEAASPRCRSALPQAEGRHYAGWLQLR